MGNSLKSLFKDHDSVVLFDLETTGLDCHEDEIIEIAAIKIDDSGKVIEFLEVLVNLPNGQKVPEKITELTGITNTMLEKDGIPRAKAAAMFAKMLSGSRTLVVAHNAHFDVSFAGVMFRKENKLPTGKVNVLDTLTIFKDRRNYPHRLENAITAYNINAKNTHRATDDLYALCEILKAMAREKDDLARYINLIGYNPKYGVNGKKLKKIRYVAQPYRQRESLVVRLGIA